MRDELWPERVLMAPIVGILWLLMEWSVDTGLLVFALVTIVGVSCLIVLRRVTGSDAVADALVFSTALGVTVLLDDWLNIPLWG